MNLRGTVVRTPTGRSPALHPTRWRLLLALLAALTLSLAWAQDGAGLEAAGTWEGAIEIPGAPLGVVVTLSSGDPEGASWSGTIDIPAQGAVALPLEAVSVDGDQVSFAIQGVPGEPTFDGVVEGEAMTGAFTQAGQEFPFSLTRAGEAQPGAAAPALPSGPAEAAEAAAEYVDPAGRFTVPVPTGWSATEMDGFVRLEGPEDDLRVDIVVADAADPEAAVAEAWSRSAPEVTLEPMQVLEPPSDAGVDRTVILNYDEGAPDEFYQAVAQVVGDEAYLLLLHGELTGLQRRNAQLQVVASGFTIASVEETDLTGAQPVPVSEVISELTTFIEETMDAAGAPGASVAVVHGGEVVFLEGFGVKEAGGEPITPETHMMIGSIGKTMTSMLVASLVDEGTVDWDTPVVEVMPRFAVADDELTQQITLRNLLCACTGVPRRDLELAFNYDELSAESVIESLATFEFFTEFGEVFQYSNQLVAAAGYAAAAATGVPYGELYEGYAALLEERLLSTVGMSDTTLDFGTVRARGDYATPHTFSFRTGEYEPASLEVEEMLIPVGPAGAHWSTAEDMAAYLATLLATGVAPSGERVVSEENLEVTWEPQVPVSATLSYGLGWLIGEYKGLPLYNHGGNTIGFSSALAFAPEADVGVVVLTNAQGANVFAEAVVVRLLELLYEQPADSVAQTAFQLEQVVATIEEQLAEVGERVPLVDALAYMGAYSNPALGDVSLRIEAGQLMVDAGEWVSELRPIEDGSDRELYGFVDPPVAGLTARLMTDEAGARSVVLGQGLEAYTFEELR